MVVQLVKQLRPRVKLDTDVYTLAVARTTEILDRFDRVICAFSGGKDSTAVLNITLDVLASNPVRFARHLPLQVLFWDEEAIPMETEEYVRRTAARDNVELTWYCLPVKHRNACSRSHPFWWPWAPEAEEAWCRPMPPEAVTELAGFPTNPPEARLTAPEMNGLLAPVELGNTAMLMGIRADESINRLRAVSKRAVDNYIIPFREGTSAGNVFKTYPIYDWSTSDVWTAAIENGWDYNAAYDRMEAAGVSRDQQRCSPAFGEEPLQKLHTYAACFPEVWDKMATRVPGAGAAVRYALTELYGYRDRPVKPGDITWPQFIAHYVQQHPPAIAAGVGKRIKDEVRRHYRKTTLPILPRTHNPETGISWEWLLMIAMRGDLKNRKHPSVSWDSTGRVSAKVWRKYVDELSDLMATGRLDEIAHPHRLPPDPAVWLPDYAKDAT